MAKTLDEVSDEITDLKVEVGQIKTRLDGGTEIMREMRDELKHINGTCRTTIEKVEENRRAIAVNKSELNGVSKQSGLNIDWRQDWLKIVIFISLIAGGAGGLNTLLRILTEGR